MLNAMDQFGWASMPDCMDAADALRALKLIERMEDLDDVQKVYSNLDITDEVAEQFAGA